MTVNETSIVEPKAFSFSTLYKSGALWITLAVLGMVAFFWTGLSSLVVAWEQPEYGHGYLIVPIAIYLFLMYLSEEKKNPAASNPQRGLGVAIVILGLIGGFVGNLSNIPDVITYGFIVSIAGLMLIVMGRVRGILFWPPVIYLIFMLPLPNFLYWPLSIKLQFISSEIGVAIIQLLNIPVFLGGNVIDLGEYKLQVAEACSGLRYLFPLASFGFLFSILYKGPKWHKIVLFLSTIPITILMNSFRIGVIGILVNSYGIEMAEGFLHYFQGWVIFVACIATLYLEAVLLQRLVKNRQPIHKMLDIDFGALSSQFGKIRNVPASRALVLTAILIIVAGASWNLAPSRASVTPQRDPLVLFPLQLANWQGKRTTLDRNIEQVLAADDYLLADYTNTETGTSSNLFIAYYKSLTSGSGIHSPEVCVPAGGWEVSRWTDKDTGIQLKQGETLRVNRAVIQKGIQRQLVYYWFAQRGRNMTSSWAAKGYTVYDSITRGRTDGALVRVVTRIKPAEKMEVVEKRLEGFLKMALAELPNYVAD